MRTSVVPMLKITVCIALLIELGGIWNELHHIRTEQVKNALYALPPSTQRAARRHGTAKSLEATSKIEGSVSIDGAVQLEQPVDVEIDR